MVRSTISDKIFSRFDAGGTAWTIKVRFSSTARVHEYAVVEPMLDGFVGQRLGSTLGTTMVRYDALDYVRILEEADA